MCSSSSACSRDHERDQWSHVRPTACASGCFPAVHRDSLDHDSDWFAFLHCRGQHVPETIEYGITSFVFRANRPFHPGRLIAVLQHDKRLDCVVRSKGICWLASKQGMNFSVVWGHAGVVFQFAYGFSWRAIGEVF